jgi:hypothetical protein
VWAEEPTLAAGESQTFVADVGTNWFWLPPGPWWLCLRVNDSETVRCWSVMTGAPYPDGIYPETIPMVPVLGPTVPMGDTP